MTKTISFPVINLKSTGSNIESCRREAGLSVRDLQDYFGFEYPQAIYKWQHGECLPTVDNLLALSRILEVKMEDLLVYEDQEVSFLETGDGSSGDRGRFSVSFYCVRGRFFFCSQRIKLGNTQPFCRSLAGWAQEAFS